MRTKNSKLTFSTPRAPDFEAGLLSEPLLLFGGRHTHIDPKTGLGLYGPYTVGDQERPPISTITVGVVGPPSLISSTKQWLLSCRQAVLNSGDQPFLYPHFPGFNRHLPFQCELVLGDTWQEVIPDEVLTDALENRQYDYYERLNRVVQFYIAGIHNLSERQPRPDVVVCAISERTAEQFKLVSKAGELKRKRLLPAERRIQQKRELGLQFLFPEMDMALGIEDTDSVAHHDLRRALKAEAMAFGLPTQVVLEGTVNPVALRGLGRHQDPATKAWNFFTALYHKAGGHPWRLGIAPGTCFVGISFYHEKLSQNPSIRTSLAQAFTHSGDGFVLRGRPFEWSQPHGLSPHLSETDSLDLMRQVLEVYIRHHSGTKPQRVVIHKSSRYWPDEYSGLRMAMQGIPLWDLVAFGKRGIQFLRQGAYPPLRGTWVRFDDHNHLLYTQGYVPFLRTYPGMRAPQPLEILEHHGTSPPDTLLREILALTRLNWNSADFSCGEPVTLAFSRHVGEILSEIPPTIEPQKEYRFYM